MDSSIHEIFIQETEDHLQNLETNIIKIEEDPSNQDLINEAFRAIHSIKGGAGLAGFPQMKDFTHNLEDLFEEIRKGKITPSQDTTSISLESLDVLKQMVEAIKENTESPASINYSTTAKKILSLLETNPSHEHAIPDSPSKVNKKKLYFLSLEFDPKIFETGINPLMFIRDLEMGGNVLAIELDKSMLAEAKSFNPELFNLKWRVLYESELSFQNLEDIFCFVAEESNIQITDLEKTLQTVDDLDLYKVHGKIAHVYIQPNTYSLPDRRDELDRTSDRRTADRRSTSASSSFIRVQTNKLENIFNTVGELLITQARLSMLAETHEDILPEGYSHITDSLSNISKVIQEQVASLRMMSLSSTFDRFQRVVRDIANDLGKKVQLELEGQDTELDKNMIEKLNDPLKHIVRNSIDHGIETAEERKEAGKDPIGLLKLSAYIENGKIVIEIEDDGKGINRDSILSKALDKGLIQKDQKLSDAEILNLIFHPGYQQLKKLPTFQVEESGWM
jgi:two-component system chemotaxis sensor kinase CheA